MSSNHRPPPPDGGRGGGNPYMQQQQQQQQSAPSARIANYGGDAQAQQQHQQQHQQQQNIAYQQQPPPSGAPNEVWMPDRYNNQQQQHQQGGGGVPPPEAPAGAQVPPAAYPSANGAYAQQEQQQQQQQQYDRQQMQTMTQQQQQQQRGVGGGTWQQNQPQLGVPASGGAMAMPPAGAPTQQPQQLTQAQLSPPPSGQVGSVPGGGAGPEQQQQQLHAEASEPAVLEKGKKKISSVVSNLFSSDTTTPDGRNVGFKPTSKLAALHEKHLHPPPGKGGGAGGAAAAAAAGMDGSRNSGSGGGANVAADGCRALYQFQVTKLRSWRTGYERLLALYDDGSFATLDPSAETPTETNRWKYSAMSEWLAIPKEKDTILLQVEKDRLKFTCHNVHRSLVLTALLQCQDETGQAPAGETIIFGHVQRQTRHGTLVNVSLHVKAYGIVEINPDTNERVQTYRYADMRACSFTSPKNDAGLIFYLDPIAVGKSRLYFIHSSRQGGNGRSDMLTLMRENCEVLGIELPMEESVTAADWLERRRQIDVGTIATSWQVNKNTRRHDTRFVGTSGGWVGGIVTRQLALTGQGYIVERDGDGVVSCRRMADLFAVVRHANSGEFTLEFTNGLTRTYTSSTRDALIVSLIDAAMTLGKNQTVHVADVLSAGFCLQSFASSGSQENELPPPSGGVAGSLFHPTYIPKYCLKRVHALSTQAYAFISRGFEQFQPGQPINVVAECQLVVEACREFNANVLPSGEGLPTSSSDKQISGCVGALWGLVSKLLERQGHSQEQGSVHNTREIAYAEQTCSVIFQTLSRLSRTPTGYKVSAELSTLHESVPLLFGINDVFCKFSAFLALKGLISGLSDRDQETEFVNKSMIFRAGGQTLVDGLVNALLQPSSTSAADGRKDTVSDMLLMISSDILQSILCTYHDTTTPEYFTAFINALADRYRALLNTLRSPTPSVIENTALLIHLLSTHAPATAAAIRDAALSSAILLHHFYGAIFSPLEGQRFLSRYLCSLWLSGPMDCVEKRLLKRMVPHGFLAYLAMPPLSPMEEEQLDELEHDAAEENIRDARQESNDSSGDYTVISYSGAAAQQGAAGTNTARLRSRIALASAVAGKNSQAVGEENFRIFFHVLTQNHSLPDLIWSQQTRRELRIALESEIQFVQRETEARGIDAIAWNHQQFRVKYPSLDNEVKVGNVYMRLWLQAGDGFIRSWDDPIRLFELLFRRLLCEIDRNIKVTIMCIRCLDRLYAIHASKIGTFTDAMMLVHSMNSTKSIETQHRLLGLLATVLGVVKNEGDDEFSNIPDNAEQLLNAVSISQLCQFVAWGHTKGENVSNLLTRALSTSAGGNRMITDGSGVGPDGSGESEPTSTAADDSYPRVWFVASTGKIPPPSEKIRGPFRLSELVLLMNEGNLSPFDLVSASHVEEYDSESSNEAQIDTGKWTRLKEVWQLRWQLCTEDTSSAIYPPEAVALLALKSLTRLVDLHRSLDSRGIPYFPIPTAKRILCGLSAETSGDMNSKPLPILAQALLCKDAGVVDQAADLIYKLIQYNEEAMPKLYLTGLFFFINLYTGSNFQSLSKLLHATHLRQHFQSGFAAAANEGELPMKDRSILGNMLPEGLLFVLENYGFERFAEVFVGGADTPEVIWTMNMRKHLIEMVQQHLGDFPLRLFQNNTTEYEYCPLPGVAYKRLEKEIFCHNYYLENLCDEERFPDWPVAEPVEVFRACLERFKKQVDQDETELEEALEKARTLLNLNENDGSKELRKSYRSLARKYHPDKNPAGREMFESIQVSYELLLPLVESGQTIGEVAGGTEGATGEEDSNSNLAMGFPGGKLQMQNMHLLIKTQLLICRRFESEMSKYKYPVYRILLNCLQLPDDCIKSMEVEKKSILRTSLASPTRASFVLTALELVYRTCLVSPLNSEELVAEAGVPTLVSLLNFYMKLCADNSALTGDNCLSYKTLVESVTFIIRTLSGVAFFESGRSAILELQGLSSFLVSWRRCIDGTVFVRKDRDSLDAPVKRYALEGIINMANNDTLQEMMISAGVVWPLLQLTLLFDPTLDEEVMGGDCVDDVGMSLAASNVQARLSVRALGMLSGFLEEAPSNEELQKCLSQLLTYPIAQKLHNRRTGIILNILNTTVEMADVIWTISMRNQLESLLSKIQKERPVQVCNPIPEELSVVGEFEYDALKDEVQIGGIYVRIFNKHGKDAVNRVANPSSFMSSITLFVARSMNQSGLGKGWVFIPAKDEREDPAATVECVAVSDPKFLMAVKALKILVHVDGLVDDFLSITPCIVPSVLFSLLEFPLDSEPFDLGCEMLQILGPRDCFANCVCREGALWRVLSVLERADPDEPSEDKQTSDHQQVTQRKARGWAVLESLTSSPSIAGQLLSTSAWMELLGVLAGYTAFTKVWAARVGAAKTLSRLLWDPKTGSEAIPLVQRFLPQSLVTILKEDPETMVRQFDSDSDTPELIWDAGMRAELRSALVLHLDRYISDRTDDSFKMLKLTLGLQDRVRYTNLEKELFIGGVYVTRFLKEPTYNLRDPTTFLELLLKRWDQELELFVAEKGITESPVASGAITDAEQDILQLVTTAIVYLCKVRETLCDKLSQWGYTVKCLAFLPKVLAKSLVGSPLLSIIRVLHVASNSLSNVEVLAVSGNSNGHEGFVDYSLRSIGKGKDSLHPDAAFMIELLKKAFQKALGDVIAANASAQMNLHPSMQPVTMNPSPAPGDGPVRKKVNVGDDPLGMMQASAQPLGQLPQTQAPSTVQQQPQAQQYGLPSQQQRAISQQSSVIPQQYSQVMTPHGTGANQARQQQPHPPALVGYQVPHQQRPQQQPQPQQYQGNQQVQFQQNQFSQQQPYRPQQHSSSQQQEQTYPSRGASPAAGTQQQYPQASTSERGQPANTYMQVPLHMQQQQQQQHNYAQQPVQRAPQQQPQGKAQSGYQSQLDYQQNSQRTYAQQAPQHLPHQMPDNRPQISSSYQQRSQITQQYSSQPQWSAVTQQQPPQQQRYQQGPTPQMPQQPLQPNVTSSHSINPAATQSNQTPQQPFHPHTVVPAAPMSYQQTTQSYQAPQSSRDQAPNVTQNYQPQHGIPHQSMPQQQWQQQQQQQQGIVPPNAASAPIVETVLESDTEPTVQYQPTAIQGSGVDARTKEDPKKTAMQQSATTGGAPGAAQGRVAILQQAIGCKLCEFLIDNVLEGPTLKDIKDPAAAKVHAIDLVKLLTKDPGYGPRFKLVLNEIPAWKKYRAQDHSLYITGHEQRADYFLTDGGTAEKKLLTQGTNTDASTS